MAQEPMEVTAMPVRPVKHGGHAEAMAVGICIWVHPAIIPFCLLHIRSEEVENSQSVSVFLDANMPHQPLLAVLLCLALTAPALAGQCSRTNFNEVTLAPGCSLVCYSEPCRVYYRLPPGKGSFMLSGGGITWGRYQAGRTARLGHLYRGSYIFQLEGSGYAPAWLHVNGGFGY